jgi:hypothetical protein
MLAWRAAVRAKAREITLPPFPRGLRWLNTATLRADQQRGRPVLIEFWDFCRINSLRTLPYLQAWHARYADAGLRVIGVHTGGFPCSRAPEAIERAVGRLGIEYPVVIDSELEIWDIYGNRGWPARYLWDPEQHLHSLHYGEGAYAETETEIGELLGVPVEPLAPVRPEDAPGMELPAQTADQSGLYAGPYEAGGVHLVCSGSGAVRWGDAVVAVDGCGVYTLAEHERHTVGVLDAEADPGVEVLQTCFTPGLPAA